MEIEELKKRDLIPAKIKEVTTDVIQVGKLKALQICSINNFLQALKQFFERWKSF